MDNLLSIRNLHTYFFDKKSVVKAVEGVDLYVKQGEVLGLVGESGCGKTATAYSIMNLLPAKAKITKGEVFLKGRDLLKLPQAKMRKIRGKEISMIFQEPLSALNPVYKVGFQIDEMVKIHRKDIPKKGRRDFILELLSKVELKDPERIFGSYPHTLSGGQIQRVVSAMAICCNPDLVIADEPTTALDVTIQVQIVSLFRKLKEQNKFTFIFISHDLRVCSQICDRIAVMYAGRIVELASTRELLENPLHPYTKALLCSVPGKNPAKQKLPVIRGRVPDPACKPSGCHFHDRCEVRLSVCPRYYPKSTEVTPGHWVRCFRQKNIL